MYIREGYTEIQNDSTFGYPAAAGGQEPVIWQVTDQDMKNGIYRLCREIERVREYIPYIDRMPETSEEGATVHQTTLYIVAGNYGYVIEPVYWGDMGTEQLQDERRPRGALVRLHRYSLWPKAFSSQDGRIEYLLCGDAKETPRASDESSGWISAFPGWGELRSLCQIAEAADESNSVKWGVYQHPQPLQYYLDYPHIYGRDYPPYNESD